MVLEVDESPSMDVPLAEKLAEELLGKLNNLPRLKSGDLVPSRVTDSLIWTISQLQAENEMLKKELAEAKAVVLEEPSASETNANDTHLSEELLYESFHVIESNDLDSDDDDTNQSFYRDAPRMFKGDRKRSLPRGTIEVEGIATYLRSHENVPFAVLDVYQLDGDTVEDIFDEVGYTSGMLNRDYLSLEVTSRDIYIGPTAKDAIDSIITAHPDRFPGFGTIYPWHEPPYTLFYLHNKSFMELQSISGLNELARQHLRMLLKWMEDNARADWDEADELFTQGKVNSKHYAKLFRPGELIYWPNWNSEGAPRAAKVNKFPHISKSSALTHIPFKAGLVGSQVWEFNGEFRKKLVEVRLHLPRLNKSRGNEYHLDDDLVDILDLSTYPLRYAKEGVGMKLAARGSKLWQLRRKSLVCFTESENGYFQAERRCMIDYSMYKRLHPPTHVPIKPGQRTEESWMDKMPEDIFLACLPPTILGFDFSNKSWRNLLVDRITEVTWNKAAFKQLVAPEETKELIMATVTVHGQRSSATMDIIDGKGQGLLMLLHGGPGTGKTLTAESIAEMQERPLYRVTCGDIGIEPKEVEEYLGHVLELGKTWGCVVLLDEADVFLEERSFTDQKRNAIISIFLRVLEYYDGILILTTNRVGSFDEAFKSRIHLALAYPKLNEEDRLKIWQNFMQMLPRSGERVDMDDLRMNLPKLARIEVNGRQIRNVVTMARHLAKYRGEMLRAKHMQDAVRSVEKFNEYLSDVKGIQDDERARGLTLR
ncbi:hypothetical protein EDB80DRAFT_110739 [Ilyonectria destructans]|nr:hypothetical protein EDB80DRAFT_110739 [Ilyonectria destructans]